MYLKLIFCIKIYLFVDDTIFLGYFTIFFLSHCFKICQIFFLFSPFLSKISSNLLTLIELKKAVWFLPYYGSSPPQTLSVFNSSTYSKINLPLIITFFIILFTILDVLSKCKPQIMVTQNFSVAFQRFFLITFQTNFLLFIFWEFEPFLIFISWGPVV